MQVSAHSNVDSGVVGKCVNWYDPLEKSFAPMYQKSLKMGPIFFFDPVKLLLAIYIQRKSSKERKRHMKIL